MFVSKIVGFLVLLFLSTDGIQNQSSKVLKPKIVVFGKAAARTEFPEVASVVRKLKDRIFASCGASVLTVTKVLTSAMCLFYVTSDGFDAQIAEKEGSIDVLAGSILLGHPKRADGSWAPKNMDLQTRRVKNMSFHKYKTINRKLKLINLDTLIIEVNEPFTFSDTLKRSYIRIYEPEELDETIKQMQSPNGFQCTMLGWGYDRDVTQGPPTLRYIFLKMIGNDLCQQYLCKTATPNNPRNFCNFDLDEFGGYCAVNTDRSLKECFGQRGDPLMCLPTFTYGFFSFSAEASSCGERANLTYPNPLVFTRVEKIKEVTMEQKIIMYNDSHRFFADVKLILFVILLSSLCF